MSSLAIEYGTHERVREVIDRLTFCAEHVSLDFDGWEDPHVKGPGLYFAVVADREYGSYADPMGDNRWPRDRCRSVFAEDAFVEATETVSLECDGGIVVAVDGEVESQMVRFRDLGTRSGEADLADDVAYEPWMGSRHMSAIETSVRPDVVATVTLSEETGRVSVFREGEAESATRKEIGGPWRAE
ncbi:diadenylate cyclase [Halorubrum cibi]|uniref:DisA checkpoint controller nucleotide-binding n=1 Tax=Halorubrum cibi TaxID=413815 RepID=A0A521EDB2_9EURY|nr:diadenylate cyclase [Halorubrum cibi]SMO81927.1 DisA checkpoint controller nucleotide-binding [Halorubrum cibi]